MGASTLGSTRSSRATATKDLSRSPPPCSTQRRQLHSHSSGWRACARNFSKDERHGHDGDQLSRSARRGPSLACQLLSDYRTPIPRFLPRGKKEKACVAASSCVYFYAVSVFHPLLLGLSPAAVLRHVFHLLNSSSVLSLDTNTSSNGFPASTATNSITVSTQQHGGQRRTRAESREQRAERASTNEREEGTASTSTTRGQGQRQRPVRHNRSTFQRGLFRSFVSCAPCTKYVQKPFQVGSQTRNRTPSVSD